MPGLRTSHADRHICRYISYGLSHTKMLCVPLTGPVKCRCTMPLKSCASRTYFFTNALCSLVGMAAGLVIGSRSDAYALVRAPAGMRWCITVRR